MGNLSFLATSDGASLAYRLDGAAEKPLLALSNSIGTTLHMWDAQLPALTRHFRVLRYAARSPARGRQSRLAGVPRSSSEAENSALR